MINVKTFQFRDITNSTSGEKLGHLVPLECEKDIPFAVNRIYYIYGVDHELTRGFHSHRDLEQILICLGGSVNIRVKTPYEEEEVIQLDKPNMGLYIGPMIWREMFEFSEHATLLVLASRHYDEGDYIRDYEVYKKEASAFFVD